MFLPVQKAGHRRPDRPAGHGKKRSAACTSSAATLCAAACVPLAGMCRTVTAACSVRAPIPAKYAKSMDFCLDLVEKSGVLCTPGSSFGPLGEGYVRFALTLPPERIAEAVQSIKASGILN